MKAMQEQLLSSVAQENGWTIHWHGSLDDIPRDTEAFTMVVAHEFFDAIPFHLLQVYHQVS